MVTARELLRLPRDARRELVRGELRTVTPPGCEHGAVAGRIYARLAAHVEAHDLGVVLVETGYVLARDPDTVRGPDVSFLAAARLPPEGLPTGYWQGPPDLAIEVVSPNDRYSEVEERVEDYLDAGTGMVLVVDPARRVVRVGQPGQLPRTLRPGDELDASPVVPGWIVGVADLFG